MKNTSHLTNSMLSAPARVRFALGLSVAAAGTLVASSAHAVTYVKANNTSNLTTVASYVANSGSPTSAADFVQFDSNYVSAGITNTAALTLGGFIIGNNVGGNVGFGSSSTNTWNIGSGAITGNQTVIDMSAANMDFALNNGNGFLRITGGSGSTSIINVAASRTLTIFQKISAQGNNKKLELQGAGNVIFNGAIASGANPLAFNVAGANVTLNAANTFNLVLGAFAMSSGTLTLGNAGALGGVPTANLSGGRLGLGVGGATFTTNLNVTNTVTLGQSGAFAGTFSGALTGNGTLQNANTGTAINNDLSFTGDLSAFTGTISYTNSATATTNWWRVGATDGTANLAGAFVVLNAGTGDAKNFGYSNGISRATLKIGELSGGGLLQGSYLGGSTLADSNILEVGAKNTSSTYSGVIGIANSFMDNIALKKLGTGTLILTANSPFYGGTTISAGTLQVGNATTTGDLGTGAVINNAALTFNRTDTFTFGNAISGSGSVTMNGSGTLALTSANGFLGALTINGSGGAGAVRLDNANAAQNVSSVAVNVNNGLTFGTGITAVTIAALSGAGNVALTNTDTNGVALSLGSTGSTYSGVLSGAGSLSKVGAGTTILAIGGQSYSGVTNISGGTLQANSNGNTAGNQLGAGAVNLSLGGRFRMNTTSTNIFNNALDVGTGGGILSFRGNSSFQPTAITGAGALTLSLDNAVTLTPNTFGSWNGSVNVSTSGAGATLRLDGAFNNASLLNAHLDLAAGISMTRNAGTNGTITTDIGTLSGVAGTSIGGSAAGTGVFTFSIGSRNEDATFAGNVVDGSTKTALTKVGSGIQTLSGTNTYTGATTISVGTLQLGDGTTGNDGTIGNSLSIVNNANLTYNRFGSASYGGVISGSGTVTKLGAGMQTLTGGNGYAGLTTVSAGALTVGNNTALGTTAAGTSVSSGATLDVQADIGTEAISVGGNGVGGNGALVTGTGTGTVGGAVTLTEATSIGGAGTLNVNGIMGGANLTKVGAGTTNFGIASTLTTVGSLTANAGTTNVNSALGGGSSAVSVAGATTLKFGTVSQTLASLSIGAGSTVTFTSSLAAFSGDGKAPSFGGGAVVPEPGTLGLLLVGAVGVLNRRRRQAANNFFQG